MAYVIKITPEMKRQFRSETTEHLNSFEKLLMVIEKYPRNQEAIHSAFRDIHSIKGNSDYLGIKDINLLAHDLEDLMDDFRNGKLSAAENVTATLFEGLDLLRDMNRRVVDEAYKETDISGIRERIRQIKLFSGEESVEEKPDVSYSDFFSNVFEQEIKVDIGKIDEFMSHISEFTITKNTLNYLTEKIVSQDHVSQWSGELKKISANISRIANTLQNDVMKLRLVKVNTLFERLPRIVRDISLRNGKNIELSLSGGETEIDQKTIEQLVDPLVHIIRNSVDHGIEPPDERIGKNKPETGSISVKSYQEGHYVIIDVTDDGRGLDAENIGKTALEKNLITGDALSSMTDEDIINLVFMPGFTTQHETTTVSGRGVGLDIVKSNIKMVGGSITLSSTLGVMTRTRMRIPVSISVSDVLLTEVSGRQYAFPFSSVLKTLRVRRRDVHGPEKRELILAGETVLPIRHLGHLLEITKKGRLRSRDSDEEMPVIVLNFGDQAQGIVVDKILKQEGILIKPLERCLAGIKEFSGSALLGDGSIALVIDPMGLF